MGAARAGDVPVMKGYYTREKLWPAESLKRRAALMGKV
jgi:hypothetical protein